MPPRPPEVTDAERALAKAIARVREGVLAADYLAYIGEARRTIRYLAEDGMTVAPMSRPCANCGHSVADHRTPGGTCATCESLGIDRHYCWAYEVPG